MSLDGIARVAVLDQLTEAYEHWAEEEQLKTQSGEYVEAQGAHRFALIVLKAMDAEENNPVPAGLTR